MVGNFPPIETVFNGEPIYGGILRWNPDGSWDRSFATTSDRIYPAALQPDGKIIIGGAWTSTNLVKGENISRLNPDRSVDTTFHPPASLQPVHQLQVRTMLVEPDVGP